MVWNLFILLFKQIGNSGTFNTEAASTLMQKFWDSAMALSPNGDDEDTRRLYMRWWCYIPIFNACISYHLHILLIMCQ